MNNERFKKIKKLIKDKYSDINKTKKIIVEEIFPDLLIFETFENNYILFEKNKIIDNNDKIWFNSKQLTKAIGYSDSRDALRKHTDKKKTENN
jgi:hypothetical protein